MPNTHKKYSIVFIILTAFFLFGVIKLFILRFEAGDIYPEYSSLRSDPLGTKALYASLQNILPDSVNRNYLSLSNIEVEQNTTFFYLGASEHQLRFFDSSDLDYLKQILNHGGRIVISFFPSKRTVKTSKKKVSPKEKPQTNTSYSDVPYKSLTDQWGFDFDYQRSKTLSQKAASMHHPSTQQEFSNVSWHSTLYFTDPDNTWNVIFSYHGRPVVIEKNILNGSIVLLSDSYVFSNEALRKERQSDLLAWCIGKNSRVIFDESHLGIKKRIGIADLIRKYRLYWFVFGIIIFSALFVWKNATHFIPPVSSRQITDINDLAVTRDHTQGFITLIRRNIHPENILDEAVSQWEKSFIENRTISNDLKEKLDHVKRVIVNEHNKPKKQLNPLKTYHTIYKILSKRNPL